jgi:hypothetical protein
MSKTLQEKRADARAEVEYLDRLIEIQEFIIEKLTNDDGQVIDTQLEFEFNELKVSIKKVKTRKVKSTTASSQSKSGKSNPRKKKNELPELSDEMITALSEVSFTDQKKKEAITYLESQIPGFSAIYWDHFKAHFKKSLVRNGRGAGTHWSFNS